MTAVAAACLAAANIALAEKCRVCSEEVGEGWRFCPRCGASLTGFRVRPEDAGRVLVGVEGPTTKVYREPATFTGRASGPAHISLARGEYEAVQVVLYPVPRGAAKHRRRLTWETGDLVGARGRIPRENIAVSAIGYVRPPPEHYGQDYQGAHPDPLMPSADSPPGEAIVTEGELQPLWVLIHAPAGASAGEYRGRLTVRDGGSAAASVDISARVRDFSMPAAMHLPAAFDFYSIRGMYPREREESAARWNARIEELEKKYYVDMLRHRVSPMRNCGYPRFVGLKGDEYRFDFSEFDRKYRFYVETLHQPRIAVAPEWPGWGTKGFESWKPTGWIGFRNPAALKTTFRAIGEHLAEKGWLDKAYIYTIDEHPGEWTKRVNALIHEGYPGLKNLLTVMVQEGYPNVDIWCPRMYELTRERLALGKRFQREGKELWVYTSGPRPPFPTLVLDWDLINCRIIPWMCWKFGLDGYLYWCIDFWRQDPWETTATYPHQNGGGFLYYPGGDGPVGSLRLEALRDGLEDYEYLWLLREYVERVRKTRGAEALPPGAAELLQPDDRVVRYFDDFAREPRILYTMREKIAGMIEDLRAILNERNKLTRSAFHE